MINDEWCITIITAIYFIRRIRLSHTRGQPNRGFGEHPHRNMEICTYVVKGALTHKDSMGTQETLKRGGIQYMSGVCLRMCMCMCA